MAVSRLCSCRAHQLTITGTATPTCSGGLAVRWWWIDPLIDAVECENEIPDIMPQALTAAFKLGLGSRCRPLNKAAIRAGIDQARMSRQYLQHLLRIQLPISGEVEKATSRQQGDQLGDKWCLDKTALVVPLFMPGVGKKYPDRIETGGW